LFDNEITVIQGTAEKNKESNFPVFDSSFLLRKVKNITAAVIASLNMKIEIKLSRTFFRGG
jgi:hypothetical protein